MGERYLELLFCLELIKPKPPPPNLLDELNMLIFVFKSVNPKMIL